MLTIVLGCLLRNGSHWTLSHTLLTSGTIVRDRPSEDSQPRKDREKCPERTKITAPEPLPNYSQGKNDDKENKDEKVHLK